MHALYDLKELLCKQLEEYGKKGEMSAAILERVDMLAHAAKNLDKIIEAKEMEESGEYSSRGRAYNDGMSYRYDGRSMARGRTGNVKRDSMGRYASDGYDRENYARDGYSRGDTMTQLHAALEDAVDERTRQEIQRTISRLENR